MIRSTPNASEGEETRVLVATPVGSKTSIGSNKSDSQSASSDSSKYKFRRKKRYSRQTHINTYFIYGLVIGACVLLAGIVGLITHYSGQIDAEKSEKLMDLRKDQREKEVRRQIEAILRQ